MYISEDPADITLKISDFGFARNAVTDAKTAENDEVYYKLVSTEKPLPFRWLAPEVFTDKVATIKSDVWAFGVTTWEILNDCIRPYGNMASERIPDFVSQRHTLEYHVATEPIRILLHDCFEFWPMDRPTFAEIEASVCRWKQKNEAAMILNETTV